jgi:glycosyltransferase involved in cell wall biosynthesis
MGAFESTKFRNIVKIFIDANGLKEYIEFLGVRTGDEKWHAYLDADIFIFPSFFESESVPRVILEAMCFKLPVVTTNWRGIPSLVENRKTGFMAQIKDSKTFAEKISLLINDSELRIKMGEKGRKIFLKKFTAENYWQNIEKAFLLIT